MDLMVVTGSTNYRTAVGTDYRSSSGTSTSTSTSTSLIIAGFDITSM